MAARQFSEDLSDRVASIVLAGGEGTRLFPLTQSRCKPAVMFGGRYRLIDIPISNSLNSKIHNIFIISQYFASDLHQYVLSSFPSHLFKRGNIQLLSPEEAPNRKIWFKGTADAVRQNLDHLLKSTAEHFLILSGDQLYNMNFMPMIQFARDTDADLVVAALPVDEPEAKRMGLMKLDSANHVQGFYEKPNTAELLKLYELPPDSPVRKKLPNLGNRRYLGSMGIYVFKRECLISILREEGDDFGRNLIPIQVHRGKTYTFVFDGYWEDIGTIASYYQANLALISEKNCLDMHDENSPIYTTSQLLPSPVVHNTAVHNSLIGLGAIIDAKEITNCIIGQRAQIKKGTVIRNSIVSGHKFYSAPPHQSPPLPPEFFIGENCLIEKAIIDEQSCIGNNVQLINKDQLQKYDGNGVYIRDGIIIVTSNTRLPDGFVL